MPCRVRGLPALHVQRARRGSKAHRASARAPGARRAKARGAQARAPGARRAKPRGAQARAPSAHRAKARGDAWALPFTLSRSASGALRLFVSLGLLALVLWLAHWQSVVGVLRHVASRWLPIAILLGIAERMPLTYRWQILLAARGLSVGFLRLFAVQLAANFFGAVLRSSMGVDAVRIAALCRSVPSARAATGAAGSAAATTGAMGPQ